MHWADVLAEKLYEQKKEHVLATAITPSGPIHVGNLREIMTTEAVYRALKERGGRAKLIYIGDTFDPLRKVYPFLPSYYESYVGMPLSEIPCPCKEHESYAHHFLEPFFESIEKLGIKPEIYYAHELYKKGFYNEAIKTSIENADRIRGILSSISGRELPQTWTPINIKCEKCKKLTGELTSYNYPLAKYKCKSCGNESEIDTREGGFGKLPWRIDWPARWKIFGVTFEAFGKDHAAAGSSWDTGKVISKEIFGYEPPMPLVYEFINLKGKGAMHGSTGVAIPAEEVLRVMSPEAIRFLFMKYEPNRHIDFDATYGIINLMDEYDKYEKAYFEGKGEFKEFKRVYELSQPFEIAKRKPISIPYLHLAIVAQIGKNFDEVVEILKRKHDLQEFDIERLKERYEKIEYWLKKYAPDDIKFELREDFPDLELTQDDKKFLEILIKNFEAIEWEAEKIHSTIHETAKNINFPAKRAFELIYLITLAKTKGPRAGYFLQSLGKDFIIKRIKNYLNIA
ncbi:MAG: lysine--tRNA ligase [Candidatus Thermoplasmatota archaeon]